MSAAGELEAERLPELVSAMRDALETLRYRWLGPPIGGPDATLRGQWVAVVLSAIVVFACFFVLGRHTRSAAPSAGSAPVQLEGASSRAAIPAELSGGSPIAGAVPVAIVAKPRPQTPARTQPTVARPLPVEAPSVTATTTVPSTSAVAPEAAPATSPTVAAASPASGSPGNGSPGGGASEGGSGSAPAGGQGTGGELGSAGRGSGGAGGSGAKSSGGGSFDSSE